MDTTSLEKTHLFTMRQNMQQIAQPLFDHSDIDLFTFSRIYKDGKLMLLSSFPVLTQDSLLSQSMISFTQLSNLMNKKCQLNDFYNAFYYLLSEDNRAADSIVHKHGLNNALVVAEQTEPDCIDCFSFASSSGDNIFNTYFKYWDCLMQFMAFFIEKSGNLVKKAEKEKISRKGNNKYNELGDIDMPFDREKLKTAFQVNHYYIKDMYGKRTAITNREFECLKHLGQGRTMKEIGQLLGLPHRTIEGYLGNLKNKLKADSKSDLINLYQSSDLIVL